MRRKRGRRLRKAGGPGGWRRGREKQEGREEAETKNGTQCVGPKTLLVQGWGLMGTVPLLQGSLVLFRPQTFCEAKETADPPGYRQHGL